MSLLQKDETLSASTEVHASAEQVYAAVSDVTRIPEWSPDTKRAEWLTPERRRGANKLKGNATRGLRRGHGATWPSLIERARVNENLKARSS
jgi:hypothetical protein